MKFMEKVGLVVLLITVVSNIITQQEGNLACLIETLFSNLIG